MRAWLLGSLPLLQRSHTVTAGSAVASWHGQSDAHPHLLTQIQWAVCRDGVGTAALSRAIKDAAATGVKVGEARRLLKLMQVRLLLVPVISGALHL